MPQTGSQLRLPRDTTSLAPYISSNGDGNGNGNGNVNSHMHGHGQTHDYGGGSEDESSESSPLDSSAFFSRVRRKPVSTSQTRLSVDQAPNMSSINAWADGLSLSIGAQMRNVPDGPDMLKQVHGQSFRNEVCIRVEWKFLSFLAVLIGLELLFAVTVIVLNHRSPWDGNWKSSSLALVFQNLGPPEPASKEGMAPGSEQALAAAAEPMNVSLSRVEGRWQLTREGDL